VGEALRVHAGRKLDVHVVPGPGAEAQQPGARDVLGREVDARTERGADADVARIVDDGAADLQLGLAEAQDVTDARVEEGEQGRIDEHAAPLAEPGPLSRR